MRQATHRHRGSTEVVIAACGKLVRLRRDIVRLPRLRSRTRDASCQEDTCRDGGDDDLHKITPFSALDIVPGIDLSDGWAPHGSTLPSGVQVVPVITAAAPMAALRMRNARWSMPVG